MAKKIIKVTKKGIRENNVPSQLADSVEFSIDSDVETDLDASRIKSVPVSNLFGANNSTVLTYNSASNTLSLQSISGSSLRVPNEITVSTTPQSDFNSVKLAVESIVGSSVSNPFSVLVFPGVYLEQSFSVPPYVTVYSPSGQAILSASNNNTDFIYLSGSSRVNNLKIFGPSNASSIVSIQSSDEIYINNILIQNADLGIKVNSGSLAVADNIDFINCLTGSYNEGTLTSDNFNHVNCITGTINAGSGIINSTSMLYRELDGNDLLGILTIDNSIFNCGSAIITNHSRAIVSSGSSEFNAKSILVSNSSEYDAEQKTADSIIRISSGQLDSSKLFILNPSKFEISFIDLLEGDGGIKSFGNLSVGYPEAGRTTSFGRGNSYTRGMIVYQSSSAGGFVNVTEQAKSFSDSSFSFPSNETSSSLYFSSNLIDRTDSLEYVSFPGVEFFCDSTGTLGSGAVEMQFWNGSSWQSAPFSVTSDEGKFLPRGKNLLIDDNHQQLRFCQRFIKNLWKKNDPISSGADRYWARIIMSGSAYSVLPQIQQTRLHTDMFRSEVGGFVTYFGSARPQKIANWNITDTIPADSSPANQDLFLSKKLDAGREENRFAANSIDRVTAAVRCPPDIDTGCSVVLEFTFAGNSSNAGDSIWNLYWGYQSVGDNIYFSSAAAPNESPNQQTKQFTITFGENEDGILKSQIQTMNFSGMIPYRQEPNIGDIMWVSLERAGSEDDDDYDGNISLLTMNIKYLSWCEGSYPYY